MHHAWMQIWSLLVKGHKFTPSPSYSASSYGQVSNSVVSPPKHPLEPAYSILSKYPRDVYVEERISINSFDKKCITVQETFLLEIFR